MTDALAKARVALANACDHGTDDDVYKHAIVFLALLSDIRGESREAIEVAHPCCKGAH